MIDALFTQPNFVAAKQMLDVAALRHEAIASNLGNLETPGYKRLDVSAAFESQLQQAIAARDTDTVSGFRPQLEVDTTAVARRRDGNTVELESELIRLQRNNLEYASEAQMVTGSLMKLRQAITGRVG